MLSVVILNVIMLNVTAPTLFHRFISGRRKAANVTLLTALVEGRIVFWTIQYFVEL
jgi:hypothetical protein